MIVRIDDDFDLYKIVYSGQCFRPIKTDYGYRFITKEYLLDIAEASDGEYEVSCSKNEWDGIWIPYFDLLTSYKDIRSSISPKDSFLKEAAKEGAGIRILRQDPFEMLISFIISQRKSIPAIKSSVEKLSELYGKELMAKDNTLVHAFPTPDRLAKATEEELKLCGLGYRVQYVLEASRKVASGALDLEALGKLSDEELFNELKKLYGVGDKVANCISLFGYHRVDRAPVDTWIKKIIESKYNGISPFEGYKSNAGIMQQYMFYAAQHLHMEL